jgi:hypothetical protein
LNKLKKFGIFTVASLTTSILAVSLVVQPAMADDEVILPPGANGTNGNPDLLSIACPAIDESEPFVEVLAPAPVSTDGLSSIDPLQEGSFSWTLGNGRGGSDSTYQNAYVSTKVMRLDLSEDSVAGDTIDLTLTGSIVDGPTTYTPTEVEFQTTVIDPTFSQGNGTSADPYLIFNQNDLNKIRCHNGRGKHFALANDISLSGKWLPIGNETNTWQYGSLDGRGFTISNLNAGFVGLERSGLFGRLSYAHIRNLTIDEPRVEGGTQVGVLVGEVSTHVVAQNIRIREAQVFGYRQAGLLIGKGGSGVEITNTEVNGILNATPWAYRSSGDVIIMTVEEVGGMIGLENSPNSHENNSVNVVINVRPQTNYIQVAADLGLALDQDSTIRYIGGYLGRGSTTGPFANFLDVKPEIKIEAISSRRVESIGGVVGHGGLTWSQIDSESDIDIVALGGGDLEVERVGGVFGYATGRVSLSNSYTDISIETANGSNNRLALSHDDSPVDVSRVGGVAGEFFQRWYGRFVRAKSNITIQGVTDISAVAGYAGHAQNDYGFSDTFASGTLSLDASNSIEKVGGYVNLNGSAGLSGSRMFGAVEIELTGDATIDQDTINPFAGDVGMPERQLVSDSFWDSTLNGDSNPADYPGLPATTSQLQSRSFLSNLGMDFDKVWKISPLSYPELRESIYKLGSSGSNASGAGSSSVSTILRPDGPANIVIPRAVKQGSKVVIKGDRLNRVTDVFVAGKRVNYMLRTNGTLTFKAPKLDPRKYQVRLESDTAGTIFKKKIRIAAR